jgi:type IV pilus assembly protein PilA
MSTFRCPQCNLVNWATAAECKRCRFVFQTAGASSFEPAPVGGFQTAPDQFAAPPPSNTAYQAPAFQALPPQSNYRQPGSNYADDSYRPGSYSYPPPANLKSGLATAGMVLGILALVTTILLVGLLIAPVGLILSIVAFRKVGKHPQEYGGKGRAIAGIVTSALVCLTIPVIAAIAVPNLRAARKAANEASALSSLRKFAEAPIGMAAYPSGYLCFTMEDLAKNGRLDRDLADGEHNGYQFAIVKTNGGCAVTATPLTTSHGTRSFYYSINDGRYRGANKFGAPADEKDPVLE